MSRIGKIPVPVPAGVDVTISGALVTVKGPKGSLEHHVPAPIQVAQEDGTLVVSRPNDERESRALHGLTRTLLANLVQGVPQGYETTRELVGSGYRVAAKRSGRAFARGGGPRDRARRGGGRTFAVESPTKFSVSGIDKQQVGEIAANIRKIRKPEPYKGKGVRYAGEVVRRKAGKAGK